MTARRSAPKALVYVQHLLGLGHLMRISRIAAALADAGVETVLVHEIKSGGAGPLRPLR